MGQKIFSFINEEYEQKFNFVPVDKYIFAPQEQIIQSNKGSFIIPFLPLVNGQNPTLNIFVTNSKTKKCYNSVEMRNHICRYLNYFIKFYDPDMEYLSIVRQLKTFIDNEEKYNEEFFCSDVNRYILSPSLGAKIERMVEDNYYIELTYRAKQNQALQYDNRHGKMLMHMTILMNMIIPLATHFIYMKNVENVDEFLLILFDPIIYIFNDVDMFSKLEETSLSTVKNNSNRNQVIWNKQDIRGKNVNTHSLSSLYNIILNIIPKYTFDRHMVNFNFTSIKRNIGFQVTDIEFEYNFIPLSSSKRDEDSNSEFDRFESFLIRQNESKYLQNRINRIDTINTIESLFGPFDPNEIDFYKVNLERNGETFIHSFQKELVFNLFFKYFGNTLSIKDINNKEYIELIISAERILRANYFIVLPEIISSKIVKFVGRKSVNKSIIQKAELCSNYEAVMQKYHYDPEIKKRILSIIASIISSEFHFICYNDTKIEDKENWLTGRRIEINQDQIIEEIFKYALLI